MTAATAVTGPAPDQRRDRRTIAVALVLVVIVGAIILAIAAPARRSSGPPLDPRSTDGNGTRGAVELARRLGAEVRTTSDLPGDDTDVVVMFEDLVSGREADALLDWVDDGGVLVVTAGSSELVPDRRRVGASVLDESLVLTPGRCDAADEVDGLDRLGLVEAPVPVVAFDVPVGASACFGEDDGSVLVADPVGSGTVVAFGAPYAFTNDHLDRADNAGLFAALAVPREGTRLDVLVAGTEDDDVGPPTSGGELGGGLPEGTGIALLQLLVAFVVYALYRGRRLGQPVHEDPPVEVAGSELVRAVGGLLEAAGARDRAAASLRRAARRRLAERFGLPASASGIEVARTVAARTTLDAHRLDALLLDGPVADDAALQALSADLDRLVADALRPPEPAVADTPTDRPPPPQEQP